MSNCFLYNEAIDLENLEDFILGMLELNAIERGRKDQFLKHESIWELKIISSLYSNFGQLEQALSKFIEQTKSIDDYIQNEDVFEGLYPSEANGFLGIDFSKTRIKNERQITHDKSFKLFKKAHLWNFDFRSFWGKREELFPSLILCGEVEQQIAKIGNSSQFKQIIDRLKTFDKAIKEWIEGEGVFSYKKINLNYSLNISPESSQTMDKFENERIFSLPTGGTATFELHIKTGDFRFHFYPDNTSRKVYVGYIGSHLNTNSN